MNQSFPDRDNNLTKQYLADFLVDKLISMYKENNPNSRKINFLEPGCGEYAPFAKAITRCKDLKVDPIAIEYRWVHSPDPYVIENIDFLNPEEDIRWRDASAYDIIATNPPFSKGKLTPFILRSLECLHGYGYMGFLFALNFLASDERAHLYRERPPYEVIALSYRPSFIRLFDGKTATDQRDYCFVIWRGAAVKIDKTIMSWTDIRDPDKKKRVDKV